MNATSEVYEKTWLTKAEVDGKPVSVVVESHDGELWTVTSIDGVGYHVPTYTVTGEEVDNGGLQELVDHLVDLSERLEKE